MSSRFIYSVYDRKAQYYLPTFEARSNPEALRMFTQAVVTSESDVSKYPADFDLVALGAVDTNTGRLTSMAMPELLINGLVALTASIAERKRYQNVTEGQLDISDFLQQEENAG